MAAHRYWRLYLTAPINNYLNYAEIELRDVASGSDLTGSGTASASSYYSGEDPDHAVDNNASTQWSASGAPPSWWAYDFGAGNTYDIVELVLTPRSGYASRTPTEFTLQCSDDGSTWRHRCSFTTSWPNDNPQTFTVVPELDFIDYPSDTLAQASYISNAAGIDLVPKMTSNTAPSGVASSQSVWSGTFDPWKVFNNTLTDSDDAWVSGLGVPQWIKYQFSEAQVILSYSITPRSDGHHPTEWTLYGSNDDSSYSTLDSQTGQDFTGTTKNTYTFSNTTAYLYYKINVTASTNGYGVAGEIEFIPDEALLVSSEATVKHDGSYSLQVDAEQTSSLNKKITRNLVVPVNLSGFDAVSFWVYSSRTGSNFSVSIHDLGGTTSSVSVDIASADTWQNDYINLTGVSDANKDAIDKIFITITNADAANTFYIDYITGELEHEFAQEVTKSVGGGALVGGTSSRNTLALPTISSGAIAGSTSPVVSISVLSASSGAIVGGTAEVEGIHASAKVATGGAVVGGSVTISFFVETSGIGGGVSAGTAANISISQYGVVGGAVVGGVATVSDATVITKIAQGGAVANGYVEPLWSDALPDDEEYDYDNIRQIISVKNNGISLRLRLQGSKVAAVTINGASWGLRSGTTGNYAVAPVRLTFNGGSNSVTIPKNGTVYTDWVSTTITKTSKYLFHMSLADASNWLKVSNKGQINEYYKLSGIDDTLVQNITGYSTSTKATAVISVEVRTSQARTYASAGGAIVGGTLTRIIGNTPAISKGGVAGGIATFSTELSAVQLMELSGYGGCLAGGSSDPLRELGLLGIGGAEAGGGASYRPIQDVVIGGGSLGGGTFPTIYLFSPPISGGSVGTGGYYDILFYHAPIDPCHHWHVNTGHQTTWTAQDSKQWVADAKGDGPWPFAEQLDKWGYLNNPRWVDTPTAPINYTGNESEEPQVWTPKGK